MSEDVQGASSVEESAQTIKNGAEFVRHWMTALDLASSEEKDWRKGADKAVAVYRTGNGDGKTESADRTFNILHANVETMLPALYNSTPVPDVRRLPGRVPESCRPAVSRTAERLSDLRSATLAGR